MSTQSGWIDAFWSPVAVTAGTAWYATEQWTGYDLVFRTYADDGAAAVPEPGSLALPGLGLFGVAAARRRKG